MRKVSFLALTLVAAAAACGADERDYQHSLPATAGGSVRISNVAGAVNVTGWDRAQVEVKARLDGSAQRVDVFRDGDTISIKVIYPRSMHDGEATLDIRVPQQSDLTISAVSADVQTSRLNGDQRITTVSGEIRAEFAKDFEGKTVSGDLRLRGNRERGDLRLSSVSGDIVLERGAGELEATTVSGDVVLEVTAGRAIRTRTTSGDLSLRGSMARDGSIDAETISGDVTVRMKPEGGFEYEVTSFSGDISNCFGKHAEATRRHGPGTRLLGTAGEGHGRVRMKSMSGDVTICDR